MAKLNVKLLNRIKRHLIAEPKRYDQATWAREVSGKGAPACGTRACIAGWAVLLSVPKPEWSQWIGADSEIADKAQDLLGLTNDERGVLFAVENQTRWTGKLGVREACKKIGALIAPRRAHGDRAEVNT